MFITFEGVDGSGKTTQLRRLQTFLQATGRSVICTREPGGTPIGDQVRHVLHDVANTAMTPVAEILLYSAARAQLVGELIRPALARGDLVLCDRFYDSTFAYQGYGRGLDLELLRTVTRFATGGLTPDLTVLFDLDSERGLARRTQGGDEMNRMDRQTHDFYRRVRSGYHALAAREPARWAIVDADRPPDAIFATLCDLVVDRLGALPPS